MRNLCIRSASCLAFVVLVVANETFSQDYTQSWRLTNRLLLGLEQDSNVEESIQQAESARSLRMQFTSQARRRWSQATVHFSYHGGYQLYWDYTLENKLINEIEGQVSYQATRGIRIGFESWGRLKMFLNREPRYALGDIGPSVSFTLPKGFILCAQFKSEALDYAATDSHDYAAQNVRIRLEKRLAPNLHLIPEWRWHHYRFNRSAFKFSSSGFWYFVNEQQQDDAWLFGGNLDWICYGILLNLSYHYEVNHSNSFGFNFDRHRLQVAAAKQMIGFLFRCYALLQRKTYADDLLPIVPLELDPEKEESNFVVVDISRDLFVNVILLLRAAWYENESPWPNLYYSKRVVHLGFEFRF